MPSAYRVTLEPAHGEPREREYEDLGDLCAANAFWADLALACFDEDCRNDTATEKVTATNADGRVTIERLIQAERSGPAKFRFTITSDVLSEHVETFEALPDFAIKYPELATIVYAVDETLAHARPGVSARGWRLKVVESKSSFTIESGICAEER